MSELTEAVEKVIEANPDTDSIFILGMLVDGVLENRRQHHPSDVKEEIGRQLNNRE